MRIIYFIIFFFPIIFIAQIDTDSIQRLDEVLVQSKRISLPFVENSHSIEMVDSLEMLVLSSGSVDEILQNVGGVDVRRRGIEGMQSDLYIRGGNFEQVLLLIDGIKMDDVQTGHHTMNSIIDPENIERIEVIKGAASRIYGQNAMNGVVNIVTKNSIENIGEVKLKAGSFDTYGVGFGYNTHVEDRKFRFSVSKLLSDGYRYNSDFDNLNGFFKADIGKTEVLATYSERKFGANGFYGNPTFTEMYEETQTHLLALKRKMNFNNVNTTLQVYWKRNQDAFFTFRKKPDLYSNFHITQKVGASIDGYYRSKIGVTGIGFDLNYNTITSTKLGEHERITSIGYLEHRFQLLNEKLDITPGVSVNYYNDFGWYFYPGLDLGFRVNKKVKLYTNLGYTNRNPTYTNLYYRSNTEEGNPDLKPESALTGEIGLYYHPKNWLMNVNYFYRNASNLIDWAKDNLLDKWQARNFSEVITNGAEISSKYQFKFKSHLHFVKVGYTYMNEDIIEQKVNYSLYSINSLKHQVMLGWHSKFIENVSQNISYRYVERTLGETYHVFDAGLNLQMNKWIVAVNFNNLFDTEYSETNLVPMPGFNMIGSMSIKF